jgi:4-aminobutyrate aminotransferase-like enzyme
MVQGAFQFMYDVRGNTFLDAYNNIKHIGHCHPAIIRAAKESISTLNTNTRYLYDSLISYAEDLLMHFPDKLDRIFFVNSGSAASDLAIRIARTATGREEMVIMEHGYHGNTNLGIDVSHYKFSKKGGKGKLPFVHVCEIPDVYRGRYRDSAAGNKYASDAISHFEKLQIKPAAFIAEPIIGCGGQIPLAHGFLREMYAWMKSQGGICISDEVQVGFGRMGKYFWGYEMYGVEPDIVILGKPMGNGHPIGAVVTTSELAERFDNGMEFFSSFGGNPVSCAIGQAVLSTIVQENLPAKAAEVGTYLKNSVRTLSEDFSCIGDVRGEGLFIGIDMVADPDTREPSTILAQEMKNELRNRYILTDTDGPANNVIKIKPPLCFAKNDVEILVENMEIVLKESQHAF